MNETVAAEPEQVTGERFIGLLGCAQENSNSKKGNKMKSLKSRMQTAAVKFGKDRQEYREGGYSRLLEFSRAVRLLQGAVHSAMEPGPPTSSAVLKVAEKYARLVAEIEPETASYPPLKPDADANDRVAQVLFDQCQADMPRNLDMLRFISDLAASVQQVQLLSQGGVEKHLETLLQDECKTLAGKLEQLCFVTNKIKEQGSL